MGLLTGFALLFIRVRARVGVSVVCHIVPFFFNLISEQKNHIFLDAVS
jgi:hypothetical protein